VVDFPEGDFADTGSIGDIATITERDESAHRCRMTPFVDGTRYIADRQSQLRIDGIEERRFADTRSAGYDADFAWEP
jgi:hypothetical protein